MLLKKSEIKIMKKLVFFVFIRHVLIKSKQLRSSVKRLDYRA